jgi:hypothetical protein
MRSPILILIFVAVAAQLFSQDTLFVGTGKTITGKVTEIGTDVVKYKRSDNLDGPLYNVSKSDISSIHYSNGSEDVFSDASSTANSNTVLVHVAGQDDQVIPKNQTSNTGLYGNNVPVNQVLNAVVLGAELLAVSQMNHGSHKRSCGRSTFRSKSSTTALVVPLVVGLATLAAHHK